MAKGRSISKISKELETLVEKMKKMAKEYAEADGVKKQKLMASLKDLTKDKKRLEKELESSVNELDKDAQLQIDEMRKLIRAIIIEEIKKKSLNEIEFETDSAKNDSTSKSNLDNVDFDELPELTSDDENAIEDLLDKALKGTEKIVKQQSESINEIGGWTIAGIIAALPKIIEMIGKLIMGLPRILSILTANGEMYGAMADAELIAIKIGQLVKEGGKSLHHKYIAFIATLLKADPVFRNAPEADRKKVAENIWLVIVCVLMVKAGTDAAFEALHGAFDAASIEGALTAIKQGEVKEYLKAHIAKILGTQV
jgi:hypothetical protein